MQEVAVRTLKMETRRALVGGVGVFALLGTTKKAHASDALIRFKQVQNGLPLNLLDYPGADPTGANDSAPAFAAAIADMQAQQRPLLVPSGGTYKFASSVIVAGGYFEIIGAGATIVNAIPGFAAITTTTTPDTSFPTTSYLGPMRGSAFYFTTIIYYSSIEGLTFSGFRFALSFLQPHNSPLFKQVTFTNCNCGIFSYTGAQNDRLFNCLSSGTNVIWVSSATAFASGSPYAGQDNFVTDGLTIRNEYGYGSFSGCPINAAFDTWFVGSILQPSIISVSATGSVTYNDANNVEYSPTDEHCLPSGRIFFIPMRNVRGIFGLSIVSLDIRGPCYRGIGLANTSINDFRLDGFALELMYDSSQPSATSPIIELGSVSGGVALDVTTDIPGEFIVTHPLISWTNRGGSPGTGPLYQVYLGVDIIPQDGQQYFGFIQNGLFRSQENLFIIDSNPANTQYDGRTSGCVEVASDFNVGTSYTDNNVFAVEDGIPFILTLPQLNSGTWYSDVILTFLNDAAGLLEIEVLNLTEGAWDYGKFYIETGATASESLTTAANLNNGDAFVAVTTAPSTIHRFTRFTVASGVEVALDYYDATNGRVYVIGGIVTGLASTVTAGSTITRADTIKTLKPFSRGWLTPGFNNVPFAGASTFGLKNNTQAYTDADTKDSLYVVIKYRAFPAIAENIYAAAAPTTGMWAQNAIVWNSNCAASGNIGWVCVTAGTPGTWKTFGAISS